MELETALKPPTIAPISEMKTNWVALFDILWFDDTGCFWDSALILRERLIASKITIMDKIQLLPRCPSTDNLLSMFFGYNFSDSRNKLRLPTIVQLFPALHVRSSQARVFSQNHKIYETDKDQQSNIAIFYRYKQSDHW